MRSKAIFGLLLCAAGSLLLAQDKFSLAGTVLPERSAAVLDVNYTGPAPENASPYLDQRSWSVRWSSDADGPTTEASVDSVSVSTATQKIQLHLSGTVPGADQRMKTFWTVLFNPPASQPVLPQVISYAPSSTQLNKPKKGCSTYFCPPGANQPPDVSITGSFLAAGGTKPIYAFSAKGNLVSRKTVFNFNPGIAADIEINQNVQPPNNRTRFDPDSITAGLSFTRVVPVQKSRLYGLNLQLGLPSGEFSRTDPSGNIIVSGMGSFVLTPWQGRKHRSLYATLYPLIGFEAGHNFQKPSQVSGVPVNFANYNGILRGVLGGDAAVGVASADRTANVFLISASYRVRLPALEEPFEKSLHQVTAVDLTTKARNWVEADINYAPWSFKYISLTAKYQYGSLPPMFNLVDHKFSLGLSLQAVQSHKPSSAPALK